MRAHRRLRSASTRLQWALFGLPSIQRFFRRKTKTVRMRILFSDRMLDDNYLRARMTIMYKNGLLQNARIAKRADQHENKTSEIE